MGYYMELLTNMMLPSIHISMKDPGLPLRKNDFPPVLSFEHSTKSATSDTSKYKRRLLQIVSGLLILVLLLVWGRAQIQIQKEYDEKNDGSKFRDT